MKKLLLLFTLLLFTSLAFGQTTLYETEDNDTWPVADIIDVSQYGVMIDGAVTTGNPDWWRYQAYTGDSLTIYIPDTIFAFISVTVYPPQELDPNTPDLANPYEIIWTYNAPWYEGPYIATEWYQWMEITGEAEYVIGILNHDNPTLPVELSSFTAQVTSENFVQLAWTTQSETDMLGYNVLRASTEDVQTARQVNGDLIPAQNLTMETHYSATDQEGVQNSTYWYWLESLEMNGSSNLHGPVNVTVVAGSPGEEEVPGGVFTTAWLGNYPNPFNPSTSIAYSLAKESAGEVAIYNTRGELVRILQDNQPAGRHSIVWNGKDEAGMACASGVYFFHLRADGLVQVCKGILLK